MKEQLIKTLSDCTVHDGPQPSKIDPNVSVRGPSYFTCPACSAIADMPKHGKRWVCPACQQGFQVMGNAIFIIGKDG